jgi:methionyl-tRNA synthetase
LDKEKILVTSAWPYLNVTPHIGNLIGSHLSADVVARYYRSKGADVLMVSGSDEHGTPIEVEAIKSGIMPKVLTDRLHLKVVKLLKAWGISYDNYSRTENPVHKEFVRSLLLTIYNNGYIFEQETTMLYCENCKRFLPDRFVEGKCPYCNYEHARGDQCESCGRLMDTTLLVEPYCAICKTKPIVRNTRHWYLDIPKLSDKLMIYVQNNKQLTNSVRNFSLSFIREGLKPRAVTRDVEWGIPAPFPGSENKTIYVWVEAVLGYISATIEYFKHKDNPEGWRDYWFEKNTRTMYFIGKDNIPFHTIILPALLLASGEDYNLPWNVSATEWLQFKGEKASKSQRRGIFMDEALKLFSADCWRYFLLASRPETKDSNFSWELFSEKVNADLNNTFGNFIHRTLTFLNNQLNGEIPEPKALTEDDKQILILLSRKVSQISEEIEECKLQTATNTMMSIARLGNQYLNEKEPWKLFKENKTESENVLNVASDIVKALALVSKPFMPSTSEEIWKSLNLTGRICDQSWEKALDPMPPHHKIRKSQPLFHKIEKTEQQLDELLIQVREKRNDNT